MGSAWLAQPLGVTRCGHHVVATHAAMQWRTRRGRDGGRNQSRSLRVAWWKLGDDTGQVQGAVAD
jgi:hypothetical protein